jgi:signal transduction histidine kinase
VDLSTEDNMVNLTIQDNGIGFSDAYPPSNGIGLTGLHERITIAGGTLNINSTPRHGTILSTQFPLSNHIRAKKAK